MQRGILSANEPRSLASLPKKKLYSWLHQGLVLEVCPDTGSLQSPANAASAGSFCFLMWLFVRLLESSFGSS